MFLLRVTFVFVFFFNYYRIFVFPDVKKSVFIALTYIRRFCISEESEARAMFFMDVGK